ncbi:DUF4249 domain-containing protein [uncultured Spirosoma sp.]|uniref:DUF4249 domain-containing protein n=1 Tax=uncultured Spirosoma sp. TaxID=278208 RepID=UPI00258D491F|nr:DUF4249 domain-containing protein [uncultured Spirosoma sp.]
MPRPILLLLLTWLVLGCVSAYDPELSFNADLVVVNGMITDLADAQTISLTRSRSQRDSADIVTPIRRAQVDVRVDEATTIRLTESQPGVYAFPADFRGKVGSRYQLRFTTEEGTSYASTVETMTAVPAIQRAYDQFTATGPIVRADGTPVPANDVYIDFQDPAGTRNFYLWRWRLYETQLWCATCKQGRYLIRDIGPVGAGPLDVVGCVPDQSLGYSNLYDYACRGQCWDIFYSSAIDTFSDVYTNGQSQVGHKVASIPIYQLDPALIVIEQLSISADAYRYYKLFADQVQNTGTLADSPPAPIAGNVKNLNNTQENVVGYFTAASVAVSRYKLKRQNITGAGRYQGLFYAQTGRLPNVDPGNGSIFGQGIPSALCVPSTTRTDLLPEGWNQ